MWTKFFGRIICNEIRIQIRQSTFIKGIFNYINLRSRYSSAFGIQLPMGFYKPRALKNMGLNRVSYLNFRYSALLFNLLWATTRYSSTSLLTYYEYYLVVAYLKPYYILSSKGSSSPHKSIFMVCWVNRLHEVWLALATFDFWHEPYAVIIHTEHASEF